MNRFRLIVVFLAIVCSNNLLFGQAEEEPLAAPDANVLAADRWREVDGAVQRGLTWLAEQQKEDGSFESRTAGQPAVTSLCLMAFLAQGESPANGQYQKQLAVAIDFIADQQKPNGLIGMRAPGAVPIPRKGILNHLNASSVYNHAISALALSEAYGECTPDQAKRISPIIEKAIAATLEMQGWGGKKKEDVGGWRYLSLKPGGDSDLSITGWQLMFLRSAKNAGFDVPKKNIDAAVTYVENCFLQDQGNQGVHAYVVGQPFACTRGMAGAGVLAMAHAGKHDSKEAIASGEWILKHDFSNYNDDAPTYGVASCEEHYHYASFLCSQAMFQLGGKYWKQFYPPLVETLLANQQEDGAWPRESSARQYGNCYSTSLCILSMSVPNQMLPILQR